MNKYYYKELKNLKGDIFIKKVAKFLMALENIYPNLISIEELKEIFGEEDYERIVNYLRSGISDRDHLIIGDKSGWRINNWNIERVQKFISRVVQEDSILEQVQVQRTQIEILNQTKKTYIIMTIATIVMAIATFMVAIK